MLVRSSKVEPPNSDERWKDVQAVMRRNGFSRDALIETLHSVQKNFGYLDEASLRYVAAALRVPLSKVFGVSTFYHLFRLTPPAPHACVLCTGTACYLNGIQELLVSLDAEFGLSPGKTTPDGRIEISDARCVGACGVAPVAVFDEHSVGKLTVEDALRRIKEWQADD